MSFDPVDLDAVTFVQDASHSEAVSFVDALSALSLAVYRLSEGHIACPADGNSITEILVLSHDLANLAFHALKAHTKIALCDPLDRGEIDRLGLLLDSGRFVISYVTSNIDDMTVQPDKQGCSG